MPGTTSVSRSGNQDIDGLLSGIRWSTSSFTFSFPASASYYEAGSTPNGESSNGFGQLSATQQSYVRGVLQQYASVANLSFTEVTESTSLHADLRYAKSNAPSTAWAYYPSSGSYGGDSWYGNSSHYYDSPARGNYAGATFIHETGHAMGLAHGHDGGNPYGALPGAHDSLEYSVMSYRSYVGGPTSGGYANETWGFPQTLMQDDIAALQYMYGANYNTNSGNTVYTWSPTTGQEYINGVGQGAPGANRIFMTVWDGGGNDTYDFSSYSTNLRVNLQPGAWTTTASAQLADLDYYRGPGAHMATGNIANALYSSNGSTSDLIENAIGGSGADTIVGNQADNALTGGGGNDSLDGGTGNDTLSGGAGNDTVTGGLGTDTAVLSGNRADYAITYNIPTQTFTLTDLRSGSPDGRDTVTGVESFRFADVTVAAGALVAPDDAPTGASLTGGTVVENATAGTVVGTVTGADPNAGDTLTYSLVNSAGGRFAINATTGQITVASGAVIDYEAASTQSITVRVTDQAGLYVDQAFTINVTDVNEAPKSATLSGGSVAENVANGTVVGTVTGVDQDVGASLTYALVNNAGGRFAIDATTGQLTVANGTLLNYEAATSHAITVRMTDQLGLTLDRSFTIALTNVNEAPTGATLTGTTVAENSANGALVGTVRGTDPDVSGTLTYALTDNAGGRFAINATSGQITVANGSLLDYETSTSHVVGVRVTDQGGLTYDRTFTIGVSNVVGVTLTGSDPGKTSGNDVLTGTAENDTLRGMGGNDTLNGQGGDDSLDGGTGADVMRGGTGNDTYFVDNVGDSVQESFGEGTDIVRTTLASYTLAANVENLTGTGSNGQTLIGNGLANVITGSAWNDRLIGGGGNDTVNGGAGSDTIVFTGNRTDYQIVLNGQTYTVTDLRAGSPDGVDTVTSVENFQFANATIGSAWLFDRAPTGATMAVHTVAENANNGAVVGTVAGVDPDTGDVFRYALVDNAGGRFAIDATTGRVTVANRALLDYETATSHNITVRVTDMGSQSVEQTFAVNVTNANEAPTNATLSVNSVAENSANGTVVGTVAGVDPDAGAVLRYTLMNNAGGRFAIDSATGLLTVANGAMLNYETGTSYTVSVRTTDQGGLSHDHAFTIGVTNVNEAPTNATLTGGNVAENSANGTLVGTVTGVDPDVGGRLSYSLLNDAGGRFAIDSSTGRVTVANSSLLDYETGTSHGISVRVTDQGGLTHNHAYTIYVSNVNGVTLTGYDAAAGKTGMDSLTGTPENDSLNGMGGNDTLDGRGGDDQLNGGTGADVMRGGTGNDTYFVDNIADQVIENAGEGTDIVKTTLASYTLAANVENLTGTATTAQALTGNSLANVITGFAGNDTINGGGGLDTLTGAAGNDTFVLTAGQANGVTITDFLGNGASAGDMLRLVGYGTAAQGATIVQQDATHWSINSADGLTHDILTLRNAAALHLSDFMFV